MTITTIVAIFLGINITLCFCWLIVSSLLSQYHAITLTELEASREICCEEMSDEE